VTEPTGKQTGQQTGRHPAEPAVRAVQPLTRLPDGTVKQVNPVTGTKVWTLPGRGARPLGLTRPAARLLDPADHDRHCAFCAGRLLETTPEIARLVSDAHGWREIRGLTAEQLDDTVPQFRLFSNLVEILTYDYWHLAHGFEPTPESQGHRTAYLSTPGGRAHVTALARVRMRARDSRGADAEPFDEGDLERESVALFAGNHQVLAARRHFTDGALDDWQNAGSGTLTTEEHWHYTRFTIQAMRDLYRGNPHARYVSAFQNWLRPAGASFDHLHKQLVAIDEPGVDLERESELVRAEPDLFARWGRQFADEQGLVVARTPTAVAFAGVGHRYPSLVVHTTNTERRPWELSDEEVRDFSDIVHACHAAIGVDVPTNEEWHHGPPLLDLPIPLRAVIKLRVSTPAGFEGGTKIYVNTIDPWAVRERTVTRLRDLADSGLVSPELDIG
jgi:galactose-1-phosphate uridylyltransferase